MFGSFNNDAMQANLGFVVSQTSHIEAEIYRIKYPDVDYASMIPVDVSANEWVKSVTYFSLDGAGQAKWINGNAKDVPVVGMSQEKFETPVYTAGIGYSYGYEEVNQARLLGISLDAEQPRFAARAYEEMVYRVATEGDAEKGFNGLYDYPGVPGELVPDDGGSSSRLWSAKSPDLILRDINSALTAPGNASQNVEIADTLILPFERWNSIASIRVSDTSLTIGRFIQENNVYTVTTGQPLTIMGKRGLLTAGESNSARMIAYRRSPEVLKLHIPMPHRFLPVQPEGLQFVVPGVFRLGGLDIRLPKAVAYRDGF